MGVTKQDIPIASSTTSSAVVGQYYCNDDIVFSVVGGSRGWEGGEEFVGVETNIGY